MIPLTTIIKESYRFCRILKTGVPSHGALLAYLTFTTTIAIRSVAASFCLPCSLINYNELEDLFAQILGDGG